VWNVTKHASNIWVWLLIIKKTMETLDFEVSHLYCLKMSHNNFVSPSFKFVCFYLPQYMLKTFVTNTVSLNT